MNTLNLIDLTEPAGAGHEAVADGGCSRDYNLGSGGSHDVVVKEIKKMKPHVLEKMKASDDSVRISSGLASLMAEFPQPNINAAIGSNDKMKPADIELVGVQDAASQVIDLLIGGSKNLKIISVVGMPGLGKTTVANSVYEHLSINKHFHVRSWCCVSQVYSRETLLADIFSQLIAGESNSSHEGVSGDDLSQMVYRILKGRRYLIVLDDIWNIKVWEEMKITFPNDNTGSRILFTTRHGDVAQEANSVRYDHRLLSDKESCQLLWLKVCDDGETCVPELSCVSERIARSCKGLPLAVVLVAGILKRTERRKECWEQVAAGVKSLGGEHGNHSEIMQLRNILELIYKHLPLCLKPCFLYFAAFPEDTSISVSKLIELWISEGLVQEESLCHKSLEEEAKSYLNELINRSLVMISKRSSNGGVKACRIHDVLRDFCSKKSQQNNKPEFMFGGIMRLQLRSLVYYSIPHREIISGVKPGDGRASERPVQLVQKLHSGREAFSEGFVPDQARRLDNAFIHDHKFLKVLDLGSVRIESSADTSDIIRITTLVHLRFLGIRPRTTEIPAEIGNLQKLETLILTGAIGYIKLPESLWNLSNLRNVLMDHGFFNFQHCSKNFFRNFFGLYNLRSVSTLSLQHGDDDVLNCILRRLPSIQKLSCRFGYSWDDATGSCHFPVLDFLNQLEYLKMFFSGVVLSPCKFSLPSNLKKLSLSNSHLPWNAISDIVRLLPNLEVLKLLNKAFEGQQWDMGDGKFPKLKFLKLESLNIQVWDVETHEQLPSLEQLMVLSCPELEEIPSSFGHISTLQSIQMKWCSSSAMDSVNQILETQLDYGNNQFKVTLIGSA